MAKKRVYIGIGILNFFVVLVGVPMIIGAKKQMEMEQNTANQNYGLAEYEQAYERWRECAQQYGSSCGNPPQSPFDQPVGCKDMNDFRCNPYYTETAP